MEAVSILAALLTPVTTILTVYIAWQQWRTNSQKLDCYDRRLKVCEGVKDLIGHDVSTDALAKFQEQTAEADFLFDKEIRVFLDEILNHAIKLHIAKFQYNEAPLSIPANYNHQEVVTAMHDNCIWLSNQRGETLKKFQPYMKLFNR